MCMVQLVKVYEQSHDACDDGDVKLFVEKYLAAIQLQCDEQRSLGTHTLPHARTRALSSFVLEHCRSDN
jgi:hypothetical protein